MSIPQLVHQSFRVLVNVSIPLLLTMLLVIPTRAEDSRTGTLLYDVDFSSPYHTVGQPPTLHPQNQQPPRLGPSNRVGDPTVTTAVGALINQPCRYGQVSTDYDMLKFVTALRTHYDNGFDELYDTYHLELNLLLQEMDADSSFNIIMDKYPNGNFSLQFFNGLVMAYPGPALIGSYTPGIPIFVEVDMDLTAGWWTVSLDEVEVYSAPESIGELQDIRMEGPYGLYTLGLDDIIICGNGECHPDPYISSHPVSGIGCVGDAFAFSVSAEGTEPISYLWYKDDVAMTGETSSTLTFDPVLETHAGDYYVRVANAIDTVFSNQATLTVYYPVTIATPPEPETQTVCTGAMVSYGVGVTGSPPYSYQWRKDGVDIDGAVAAGITFNPVTLSDDAVYDVVVSNMCGPVTSDPCTLVVHTAPLFTLHPVSEEKCIGDDVTFTCAADGIPAPSFQWYHDSDPVGTGTSLTITGLTADDEGSYWVTADNHCSDPPVASNPAYLNVLPNQLIVPDDYATIQGAINEICYHDGEIIIRDGVYSGAGNYNLDLGGKQLHIHSEGNDPLWVEIACGWNGRGFIISGGQGSETIISGLTISSGDAGTGNGGGIYCAGSSPTIDNCIIKSCVASSGGGMAGDGFSGSLVNCTFYDNYCDNYGGGLYLYNSSEPNPTGNCTFYGNEATRGSSICVDNSILVPLTNTILTAGIANSTPGEVVHLRNMGLFQLQRSDVWNNLPAGCDWLDGLAGQDPFTNPVLMNRMVDPLFCDEGEEDFTLQLNSPCSEDNSGVGQIGAWGVGCITVDDDDTFEFGVEWVNDYVGDTHDLWLCDDDANFLDSTMSAHGWGRGFNSGSFNADHDHWSGDNNDWVDDVDLVLFRGHGTSSNDGTFDRSLHGPMFREPGAGEDFDCRLTPGEAYECYGNEDAEWIAFGCCSAVRDSTGGYWARAFDGAHLIMGYHTPAGHCTYASTFVKQLVSDGSNDPPKRVAWSWFKACDLRQSASRIVRAVGETIDMKYDYVWGQDVGPQPDPEVDEYYSYWDHQKGLPYAVPELSRDLREVSMNYYAVEPVTVDEAYVENLGNNLGIYSSVEYYGDGNYYMASGDLYLAVNQIAGFDYGDLSKLWLPYESAPSLPSLEQARQYADNFLTGAGVLPDDALAEPDLLYSDVQGLADKGSGNVLDEFPTDIQVCYKREVNSYPVVGAGSVSLAYIDQNGDVSGLSQIWRDYSMGGSVEIYDSTDVMDLFDQWQGKIVLTGTPLIQDYTLSDIALAYYEEGFGQEQDYIFPVYMLFLDINQTTDAPESTVLFVPAAEMFVKLIAEVTSPDDPSVVVLGENVTFNGIGHFGTPPYSGHYWTSDQDGSLGSGETIEYDALTAGIHSISLALLDSDGTDRSATVDLLVSDNADFGDAPDPGYPTLLANGGPAHHLVPTICLGSQIDAESDGQPDATASGDDLVDLADEDGILFNGVLAPGLTTSIMVTTSASGYLNGWLDFNSDSDWEDDGEQVFVDVPLDSGETSLNIEVPEDAVREETFARFRFSTRSGLSYTGTAPDGEVEDYRVTIVCELDSPEGSLPENEPCGIYQNQGCNNPLNLQFTTVACLDTILAESWADDGVRDTDWYELEIPVPMRVMMSIASEIPLEYGLVPMLYPGHVDCDSIVGNSANPSNAVTTCSSSSLEIDMPYAGTYWLWVGPSIDGEDIYDGYPCDEGPFNYYYYLDCLEMHLYVDISFDGTNITLSWDDLVGVDYYKVYSASDPYGDFPDDWTLETPVPPGLEENSWNEPFADTRKFYRVVAVAESRVTPTAGLVQQPSSLGDHREGVPKTLPELFRK